MNKLPAEIPIDQLMSIDIDKSEKEESLNNIEVGETINIVEGPFKGFMGKVVEVINKLDKNVYKVELIIFGREMALTLERMQIAKQ